MATLGSNFIAYSTMRRAELRDDPLFNGLEQKIITSMIMDEWKHMTDEEKGSFGVKPNTASHTEPVQLQDREIAPSLQSASKASKAESHSLSAESRDHKPMDEEAIQLINKQKISLDKDNVDLSSEKLVEHVRESSQQFSSSSDTQTAIEQLSADDPNSNEKLQFLPHQWIWIKSNESPESMRPAYIVSRHRFGASYKYLIKNYFHESDGSWRISFHGNMKSKKFLHADIAAVQAIMGEHFPVTQNSHEESSRLHMNRVIESKLDDSITNNEDTKAIIKISGIKKSPSNMTQRKQLAATKRNVDTESAMVPVTVANEPITPDRWVKILAPKSKYHQLFAKIRSLYSNGVFYAAIAVDELDADSNTVRTQLKSRQLQASSQFVFASDEEVKSIEDRLAKSSTLAGTLAESTILVDDNLGKRTMNEATTSNRSNWLAVWESTPSLEDFDKEYHLFDDDDQSSRTMGTEIIPIHSSEQVRKRWRYLWTSLPENIAHIAVEDEIEIDL